MDWLKFGQNAFKEVLFEKRISIFLWAKIIALSKEKYKSIKLNLKLSQRKCHFNLQHGLQITICIQNLLMKPPTDSLEVWSFEEIDGVEKKLDVIEAR